MVDIREDNLLGLALCVGADLMYLSDATILDTPEGLAFAVAFLEVESDKEVPEGKFIETKDIASEMLAAWKSRS